MAGNPSRETCDRVDERDLWRCVRCGTSLHSSNGSRHHRKLRRSGDHSPENLVLLCGSGTTGCHGWAHHNPAQAREVGLIVPSWVQSPSEVPIRSWRGWMRLEGGEALRIDQGAAEAMFLAAGILSGR